MIPSSVFAFLRRAVPTVALLFGASALLLLTDRQSAKRALPAIAVLQQTSSMVLEDAVKGMIAGLTERGFVDGKTVTIRRYNAEGDIAQGNAIARDAHGNALGGVRLPPIEVPLAEYQGSNKFAGQGANFCFLLGSEIAFPEEKLKTLYPTPESYLQKLTEAAEAAVAKGLLEREDAAELIANARKR